MINANTDWFKDKLPGDYIGQLARVTDRDNQIYLATEDRWVLQITWTNCTEQMPPSTGEIIIKSDSEQRVAEFIKLDTENCVFFHSDVTWQWTPYTPEKWEALNK